METRLIPAHEPTGTPAIREIRIPIERNGTPGTADLNKVFYALLNAVATIADDRVARKDAWVAVHDGDIVVAWPVSGPTPV